MTPPCVSLTVPDTVPVVTCPVAGSGVAPTSSIAKAHVLAQLHLSMSSLHPTGPRRPPGRPRRTSSATNRPTPAGRSMGHETGKLGLCALGQGHYNDKPVRSRRVRDLLPPAFASVQAKPREKRDEADRHKGLGPTRPVEPRVPLRDQVQRQTGVDEPRIVEALALTILAAQRHGHGQSQIDPIELLRVLGGLDQVAQGLED